MKTRNPLVLLVASLVISISVLAVACSAPAPAASPTVAPAAPATAAPSAPPTAAPAAPVATAAPAAAPTTAPAKPAAAAAPTGDLKVALSSLGGGAYDSQLAPPQAGWNVGAAIFDYLVGVGPDGKPVPGLAEKWEWSPDFKTWTFSLRKGVKFHDGSAFTANDVKFSIDRILKEGTSNNTAEVRNRIAEVQVKDDYTVVFVGKAPQAELWAYLGPFLGSEGLIMPQKYIEAKGVQEFRNNPVGTGPWKVVKNQFNVEIQLQAVENHWRTTPKFKNLTITMVPELGTRLAMVKTGQADVVDITPDGVKEAKAGGAKIVSSKIANGSAYWLYQDPQNYDATPVGNLKVRQALSMAINRKELADSLFGGLATPATSMIPPFSPYYDANAPSEKPYVYDPAGAKKLLAEGGYPNGFKMKNITAALSPFLPDLTQAIVGYWRAIGVQVDYQYMDWPSLQPHYSPKNGPYLHGNAITWAFPPTAYLRIRAQLNSTSTHQNHNNQQLNSMLDKADATMEPVERKKLANEAMGVAKEDYLAGISLLWVDSLVAAGPKVAAWTPNVGNAVIALEYEKMAPAR